MTSLSKHPMIIIVTFGTVGMRKLKKNMHFFGAVLQPIDNLKAVLPLRVVFTVRGGY